VELFVKIAISAGNEIFAHKRGWASLMAKEPSLADQSDLSVTENEGPKRGEEGLCKHLEGTIT